MFKYFWPVLLIVMGVFFLQEDIRAGRDDKAFRDHGESATLAPIKEYIQTTYSKRKGVDGERKVTGVTATADLVYTTKTGETVVVPSRTLTPIAYTQLEQGVPIVIQYLPERPQTIRLPGAPDYDSNMRLGIYAMLFGALFWFYRVWTSGARRAAED